jgi:formate dehydrogenase iron-sulfur subunit
MTLPMTMLGLGDEPTRHRTAEGTLSTGEQPVARIATPMHATPLLPLEAGQQYRFVVDMTTCVGCHSCEVACAEQNGLPVEVSWRRVADIEGGTYPTTRRFNLSMACNHCLEPACMTGCPTEAYVKLPSGIVQHLASECIGCQYCTWNCPYSVPVFHPARKIVSKCDLCKPRLEAGLTSACVDACPTHAIAIEPVDVAAWRLDPSAGDAPHLPPVDLTLSTTRIVLPDSVPASTFASSDHDLRPEHAHAPLIAVTVLTQIAVGLLLAASVAALDGDTADVVARIAFAASALALPVSLFHLGRPIRAWKAIRGWRRSWLSREVIGFGALASAGMVAAVIPNEVTLGGASVVGLAAVYASGRLYVVPGRPAWNSWHTVVAFIAVSLQVGATAAISSGVQGTGFRAVALLTIGAALAVPAHNLFRLSRSTERAFRGTVTLAVDHVRGATVARLVLGLAAGVTVMVNGDQTVVGLVALVFVVMAAVVERWLFFVTVVPLSTPVGFSGGGHR